MIDKRDTQQILGCLMKQPQLLSKIDKYSFVLTDFPSRFERSIFMAINGLYRNGATKIQPIDIENFLESDQVSSKLFKDRNGIEYLQDSIELSQIDNFDFYYNRFKMSNLLKDLKKQGFDTSDFYCDDLTNPKADEINQAFNFLNPKLITDAVRKKLLGVEAKYQTTDEIEVETAVKGMEALVDELGAAYEIGIPIQGDIYNQVISGAKKGTLTIRSAASGVGKTRNAVADACYLAYPFRYNSTICEWEQKGNNEKVLFIVTEQRFKEVRTMILAYLTDINATRFKYADFSKRESAVITQAIHLMKKYDNLILVKMPNPTIESVKTIVRENCIIHDIGYVFYDYIFIGPSLLNEFKGFALRNDEVLLMFATALKDLAVELDVAMFTSTQLNAKGDDNKDIRNEGSLAGGRSTINKADNGAIIARPTKEELELLEPLFQEKQIQGDNIVFLDKNNATYIERPNLVTDIFKVRNGEWTQVRIWSVMNLGTLRKKDLFITDSRLEPIKDFYKEASYNIKSWEDSEDEHYNTILERLNDGEIVD